MLQVCNILECATAGIGNVCLFFFKKQFNLILFLKQLLTMKNALYAKRPVKVLSQTLQKQHFSLNHCMGFFSCRLFKVEVMAQVLHLVLTFVFQLYTYIPKLALNVVFFPVLIHQNFIFLSILFGDIFFGILTFFFLS